MNNEICDVLIVGAGPAGLASAIELLQSDTMRVVLLEKGKSHQQRHCNAMATGKCNNCQMCAVLSGVGGASGMLGGKLCFFPAGACLSTHIGFSPIEANGEILSFLERNNLNSTLGLSNQAIPAGNFRNVGIMGFKDYYARRLLKPDLQQLFVKMVKSVIFRGGIIKTGAEVIDITSGKGENRFSVVYNLSGEQKIVEVRKCILLATGRSGAHFLSNLFPNIGISKWPNKVDVGIRLEIPSQCLTNLPLNLQDPKFKIYENTPNEVRTLCWCRGGQLSTTNIEGIHLVDGHFGEKWQPVTSVSIVSRIPVPENSFPLSHAIKQFNHTPNLKGPLHQSLAQFLGIRFPKRGVSTMAKTYLRLSNQEVNLSSIITKPILTGIIEMLEELNNLVSGRLFNSNDAHIYAPVIDKFWERPSLDANLMTDIPGLYVAGDATGLGRGIIQGLFSGIVVAQSIVRSEIEASLILSNSEAALLEVG